MAGFQLHGSKKRNKTKIIPVNEDYLNKLKNHFTSHRHALLLLDFHSVQFAVNKENPFVGFKCVVCNHCINSDGISSLVEHLKKRGHWERLYHPRRGCLDFFPPAKITNVLETFLDKKFSSSVCSDSFLFNQNLAFEAIRQDIRNFDSTLDVSLIGSSYHGLGLRNCGLDISLSCDDGLLMHSLVEYFRGDSKYRCVEQHFSVMNVPHFSFVFMKNVRCKMYIYDDYSVPLSKLLIIYANIDVRCRKLFVLLRQWASVCEVRWPTYRLYLLVIFFLQRIPDKPVLPVLHGPLRDKSIPENRNVKELCWKTENTDNLAVLWLRMFQFYSSSASDNLSIKDSFWEQIQTATDHPFSTEVNDIPCSIFPGRFKNFIDEWMRFSYWHFSIPRSTEGPLFSFVRPNPDLKIPFEIPGYAEYVESQLQITHNIVKVIPFIDTSYERDPEVNLNDLLAEIYAKKNSYTNLCCFNLNKFHNFDQQRAPPTRAYAEVLFLDDANYLMSQVNVNQIKFSFSIRKSGVAPLCPKWCAICLTKKHTVDDGKICRNLLPPVLEPVRSLTPQHVSSVDEACQALYKRLAPTAEDMERRDMALDSLQGIISGRLPEVNLLLFGSSKNGFCQKNSDLDICVSVGGSADEDKSPHLLLETIYQLLQEGRDARNLQYIRGAKVPIIKFKHVKSRFDCDLSAYNDLAVKNTRLLKVYCDIDERVPILGLVGKQFSKLATIVDASRGLLSSYCYSIMMIYFLQRCNPPVLPVLQALPKQDDPLPESFVSGYNTYYFDDIANLSKVWPGYRKNTQSVGQLWIDFLRFYTEEFDISSQVVSIKHDRILLKLEKRWFTNEIAVEDPFITERNLGSSLTYLMNSYIIQAFRIARKIFTSPPNENQGKPFKSFFDDSSLSKLIPPYELKCRKCRAPGHRIRECPKMNHSQDENRD